MNWCEGGIIPGSWCTVVNHLVQLSHFQFEAFLYFFIFQVMTSQPEEVNMYYQSTYEGQPYGSSYSFSYSYSSVGADEPKPIKPESSVTYSAPSSELTPITTDLVKKRLNDR